MSIRQNLWKDDITQVEMRPVISVSPDSSLREAIEVMREARAGGLLICEADKLVGIFTERDVLRCHVAWRHRLFRDMPLREAMTDKLIVARPEDLASSAMAMMIKADIRHLPVVDNQRIVCMLTIADLVKHHVGELTAELHYLQDYITDLQDAVQD